MAGLVGKKTMEKLIRFEGGGVRCSEIEGIRKTFGDTIAIVTKDGNFYQAQYPTHREADEDLVRMQDEFDAWGAAQ